MISDFLKQLIIIPKCKCCGKPADSNNLCRFCQKELAKQRIPQDKIKLAKRFEYVSRTYASYYYKDKAKDVLTRAKFTNPASFLASLLTDISIDIHSILSENNIDIITTVPSHKSKFYRQEFDLPQEMAKRISAHCEIPYIPTGIKKIKTPPQHNLPLKQRRANLVNAFEITEDLQGKNILLIDDVITTGITISTYAADLKLAGAEKVIVWAYTYNTYEI